MSSRLNGPGELHFITPKEAATYLQVTVRCIYNWIDSRHLPARDFGTKKHPVYRIPKNKFIEWANLGTED